MLPQKVTLVNMDTPRFPGGAHITPAISRGGVQCCCGSGMRQEFCRFPAGRGVRTRGQGSGRGVRSCNPTTCGSAALGSSSPVAVVDDLETLEGEEGVNVLDRLGLS